MTSHRTWIGPLAWFAIVAVFAFVWLYIGLIANPEHAFGYPAKVTRWTPTIRAAAKHYHLSAADTRWVVTKGLGIIYRESRGNERTGHVRGCYGLLQFNRGWIRHSSDWRGNGKASVYRFVKVLHDGGRRAVARHWAATLR